MAVQLAALCIDARDPLRLGRFWSGVLGWEPAADCGGIALVPNDDTGFRIRFLPSEAEKIRQNQMHFDLTSATPEAQKDTVDRVLEPRAGLGRNRLRFDLAAQGDLDTELDRLIGLGAARVDARPGPHGEAEMTDPDGNEFTVWP